MKDIVEELNKYPEGYWDFKGKIKTGIHNIGQYPATMVPDMQYELLNLIIEQIGDTNIKLLENTLYKMIHEYTYHEIQSA